MSFTKFYKQKYGAASVAPASTEEKAEVESTEAQEPVVVTEPETVTEKPVVADYTKMSKDELDKYAASFGIELDRRKSQSKMRKDFENAIATK